MNNRTLRDFFYGKLSPWDDQRLRGTGEVRAVKALSDAEDQLSESLPPDLRPALDRLLNAQVVLDSIVAETSYINGFKTGARFMMEILDDTQENLKPITD